MFVIHSDFHRLTEQAEQAPVVRRVLGRMGLSSALLLVAFTAGGVIQGYPPGGSFVWAAYHGVALAVLLIGTVSLVEAKLPSGAIGVLFAMIAGALGWALAIGVGEILWQLHYHDHGDLMHVVEHARPQMPLYKALAVLVMPGVVVGLGAVARRRHYRWVRGWKLSLAAILACLAVLIPAIHGGWQPPKPIVLLVLAGMMLPLAQMTAATLLLGDAFSLGRLPRQPSPPDPGPRPKLQPLDRAVVALSGGPVLELTLMALALGLALGVTHGLFALLLFLVAWLVLKVSASVAVRLWGYAILRHGEWERARDFLQYQLHGRGAEDPIREELSGSLAVVYLELGRTAEALALLEERVAKTQRHSKVQAVDENNLAVALLQTDQEPERVLALATAATGRWDNDATQSTLAAARIVNGEDPAALIEYFETHLSSAAHESARAFRAYWLSRAYAAADRLEDARAALEQAAAFDGPWAARASREIGTE